MDRYAGITTTVDGTVAAGAAAWKEGVGVQPRAQVTLVHAVPGRCRLRIDALRSSTAVRERLERALTSSPLVRSYRVTRACGSMTVVHRGTVDDVLSLVQVVLALSVVVNEPPSNVTTSTSRTSDRRARDVASSSSASRRLVVCSAVGLALVLLPQPVSPAWVIAELVASLALTVVEFKLSALTDTPALARILGMAAMLVSLSRAASLARALATHALKWLIERIVRSSLQAMRCAAA